MLPRPRGPHESLAGDGTFQVRAEYFSSLSDWSRWPSTTEQSCQPKPLSGRSEKRRQMYNSLFLFTNQS